jgi:hypothetical protein
MALTIFHHYYGSIIYEAPFRLHVVYFGLSIIAILSWLFNLSKRELKPPLDRIVYWGFLFLAFLVPTALIGLYEGGYNHMLKNILFFTNYPESKFIKLYPPPMYEAPDNLIFEFSGSLQFFFGLYSLLIVVRLLNKTSIFEGVKGTKGD